MGWPFSDKLQGALWDRCLGELFLKNVKILGPSLWAVEGILEAGTCELSVRRCSQLAQNGMKQA